MLGSNEEQPDERELARRAEELGIIKENIKDHISAFWFQNLKTERAISCTEKSIRIF